MTEITVVSDNKQMSVAEAESIHQQIIDRVQDVRNLLVKMEVEAGWASLGYDSWEAYLKELGRVTRAGSKYLRRIGNAGLLEADTGHDIGTFREGVVRPINETLSDYKGFDHEARAEALELAIELAGSTDDLTGPIAQQAAWQVAVARKTPPAGDKLVLRMQHGFTSIETAYAICQIIRSTAARGIEPILAELTDVELAKSMVNLHSTNGEGWQDVRETIERSGGYMPTRNGQVLISRATNKQLIDYLNEPSRMQRHDAIVEESEMFRRIGRAAANLMISYYGVSAHGLPEALLLDDKMFEKERELYELCQSAGLIGAIGAGIGS